MCGVFVSGWVEDWAVKITTWDTPATTYGTLTFWKGLLPSHWLELSVQNCWMQAPCAPSALAIPLTPKMFHEWMRSGWLNASLMTHHIEIYYKTSKCPQCQGKVLGYHWNFRVWWIIWFLLVCFLVFLVFLFFSVMLLVLLVGLALGTGRFSPWSPPKFGQKQNHHSHWQEVVGKKGPKAMQKKTKNVSSEPVCLTCSGWDDVSSQKKWYKYLFSPCHDLSIKMA